MVANMPMEGKEHMVEARHIKPGMAVEDTQGRHIGTVERVHDANVDLARDGFVDQLHHFVPLAAVTAVEPNRLIVEPGHATSVEAVIAAIDYARAHASDIGNDSTLFGSSGHGTGMGGSGIGG